VRLPEGSEKKPRCLSQNGRYPRDTPREKAISMGKLKINPFFFWVAIFWDNRYCDSSMVSEWEKSLARRVLGVKTHGFPAEFPLNQSIDHHCILRKNHQLSNIHQYSSIFINIQWW
jgi:hypothetical protein